MKGKYFAGMLAALLVLAGQAAMGSGQEQEHQVAKPATVQQGMTRVWVKKEITPAQREDLEVKKLQAEIEKKNTELEKSKKLIVKLQYKLASVQQRSEDVAGLQAKADACEQAAAELRDKLAVAESRAQGLEAGREQLEGDLQEARTAIQELHAKLEEAARTIADLQTRLTRAEDQVAAVQAAAREPLTVSECEALQAQLIGLEKLVDVKEAALGKVEAERRKWELNREALLSRVSALQTEVEQLREERQDLIKDLGTTEQ